jgi:hypothetical protein
MTRRFAVFHLTGMLASARSPKSPPRSVPTRGGRIGVVATATPAPASRILRSVQSPRSETETISAPEMKKMATDRQIDCPSMPSHRKTSGECQLTKRHTRRVDSARGRGQSMIGTGFCLKAVMPSLQRFQSWLSLF